VLDAAVATRRTWRAPFWRGGPLPPKKSVREEMEACLPEKG